VAEPVPAEDVLNWTDLTKRKPACDN